MQATPVVDHPCVCGEGPLWHADESRLYWTDIPSGHLFRFDPATGEHEMFNVGRQVGGYTIQDDGDLLLFMDRGTIATWRDGAFKRTIVDQIADEVETRFNDVFADPEGRVFCGTMPVHGENGRKGRLYRLDTDGSIRMVDEGFGCANGMGLTPDGSGLYFTDTGAKTIYRYDYDRATGEITHRTPAITIEQDGPGPDGMTVDADGNIWTALWGGEEVRRYAPTGDLLDTLAIPGAKQVTCPTFAGSDLRTMFITTAGGSDREKNGENAGALFRAEMPVAGVAEHRSQVS